VTEFEATIATLVRDGIEFESLSHSAAMARVSALELEARDRAILLSADGRIDVHELLTSYLRRARRGGADVRVQSEVQGLLIESARCRGVMTSAGRLNARWVVDAAGAWSGEIAKLAGAAPVRLEPRRRTIVTFESPPGLDVSGWPLVISDVDQIYFSPESTGLLLSPMDQVPTLPCDAQPDDETIAAAMERLHSLAPLLVPRAIKRKWAGLRTFASDSIPVVGEDPRVRGFFWLAGQGGFGIESSPALGEIAADLLVYGTTQRFDASLLSPARFGET
jgi:D-arginine dehydrogenase